MNLLIAVADDLATFALSSVQKLWRRAHTSHSVTEEHVEHRNEHDVIFAEPRPERLMVAAPLPATVESEVLPPLPPYAHLETVFEPVISAPRRNTVVYVSTANAPLRSTGERGVDNVIERMPYGAMLVAMETKDEWVRVFHRGTEGYVELHDLADRAAYVYPKFIIGEANLAHDPNTERVRAMIDDTFSYGEGGAALQAEEYVTYKLKRSGIEVAWGNARPRTAGSWSLLLKDVPQVSQDSEPKPRSIMEWKLEHGGGHLAFVESVYPDATVQISEANWPDNGVYNERVLVEEEWKRLSPTFISFS